MDANRVFALASCAVLFAGGCAHHRVGRPPTAAEIEEINHAAGDERPAMFLSYAAGQNPEAEGIDPAAPVRPIPNAPPFEIERVVGVDAQRLTVIDAAGQTRSIDLSKLWGVETRSRSRSAAVGGVIGGAAGLAVSGLIVLSLAALSGGPDQPVTSTAPPSNTGPAVAFIVGSTAIGALLGALCGHHDPGIESFDFGDARRLAQPPVFGR
jgi:hypothetical protein